MSTDKEIQPFSLGSSVYGGRPTFLLTRRRDDETVYLTLYELLPEDQAMARRERLRRRNKSIRIVEIRDALLNSTEVAPEKYDWQEWVAVKVAQLSEGRLNTILPLVEETLKETDIDTSDVINAQRGEAFVPEQAGVRLALGFMGVKPLHRIDRMRALARGVARMSADECYYWHAKCRSPASPNGEKALRVLLTDHI